MEYTSAQKNIFAKHTKDISKQMQEAEKQTDELLQLIEKSRDDKRITKYQNLVLLVHYNMKKKN